MKLVLFSIADPVRYTFCILLASFSWATARASSYVAPPTMKMMMSCECDIVSTLSGPITRPQLHTWGRSFADKTGPANGYSMSDAFLLRGPASATPHVNVTTRKTHPLLMLSTVLTSSGWCCVYTLSTPCRTACQQSTLGERQKPNIAHLQAANKLLGPGEDVFRAEQVPGALCLGGHGKQPVDNFLGIGGETLTSGDHDSQGRRTVHLTESAPVMVSSWLICARPSRS